MTLNDLLQKQHIDPSQVMVMRHRPTEPTLRRVLPWLVHKNPSAFNAYQQKHGGKQEAALEKMVGEGYIASFIGLKPKQAAFAGLYRINAAKWLDYRQFWSIPANQELKKFGMNDWSDDQRITRRLWFDLVLQDFHREWCGKLVVSWPGLERAWWRRAEKNDMSVMSIGEESLFAEQMPEWRRLILTWKELQVIPASWCNSLSQWRGIYLIHDRSDGKSYVGSAYGAENILGRWLNYASSGHGDNKLLRSRKPDNFYFSILQRVSPDLEADEIIRTEATWKEHLHTRGQFGLNSN